MGFLVKPFSVKCENKISWASILSQSTNRSGPRLCWLFASPITLLQLSYGICYQLVWLMIVVLNVDLSNHKFLLEEACTLLDQGAPGRPSLLWRHNLEP